MALILILLWNVYIYTVCIDIEIGYYITPIHVNAPIDRDIIRLPRQE